MAKDRLIGLLRFYQNAFFDENKQRAIDALALSEPQNAAPAPVFISWRLDRGFVSGPIHLLVIMILVLVFILLRRFKK